MKLIRFITAVLASALVAASCYAVEPVNPRKDGAVYVLGPYPVPVEYEEVKGVLYTWLMFTIVVEDRTTDPTYKLILTLKSQLNTLGPLMQEVVRRKFPQDNCARINNADNWVYGIDAPQITVRDEHTLRIEASGSISTWTCTEGVPETVCDHYTDSLGIKWPYNCKTRPTQIKLRNFEQGYTLWKDIGFDAKNGEWLVRDYKPFVDFHGNDILNFLALVENNLGAALSNALLQPKRLQIVVPEEYKVLNPKYEIARFEVAQNVAFLAGGASVSTSVSQINAFMKKYFGNLFEPLAASTVNTQKPAPMTKARMKVECRNWLAEDPARTIEDCAAQYGFPYSALPDN